MNVVIGREAILDLVVVVGRRSELTELADLARHGREGRGGLVWVTGEAGIGKTTVGEQAALAARAAGMVTAWAGCADPAPAFAPWRQLLAQIASADPLAAPPPADRGELFAAVVDLLRREAAARPLHLTIDDLHLADDSSMTLLRHVAAHLRSMPLLIVITSREDIPPALRPHARVLRISGLDDDELSALITDVTGQPAPPSTVEVVRRHTAGNPLFARELALMLGREGTAAAGDPQAPAPLPETVRGVLNERLDTVSAQGRHALAVASAIGDEVTVDLLGRVLGLPPGELLPMLEEALAARVLLDAGAGRFRFSHPLMRAAAYSSLGLVSRVDVHRRIGDALAPADVAARAHHYLVAAADGSAAQAYAAACAAARESLRLLAYEQAAAHFGQAVTAASVDPRAGDGTAALLGQGQAYDAAGQPERARQAYLTVAEAARAAGDSVRLAEAALGLAPGNGFEVTLFDRVQIDLLEQTASGLDGVAEPGLSAMVIARLSVALSLSGDPGRREQLSEQAVELARKSGRARVLAYALAAHCDTIAGPDDTERRLAEAGEVVRLACEAGDPHTELLGRRLRLVALLESGDLAGADREMADFAAIAKALRQATYDWYPQLWQGMTALMRHRFAEVERCVSRVRRLGEPSGSGNAELLATVQEFYLNLERGHVGEAVAAVEAAAGDLAGLGPQVRVILAFARARAGDVEVARARLAEVGAAALESLPRDSEWLPTMVQALEVARAVGDAALATWAGETLAPYRDRWVVEGIGAVVRGPVSGFLTPAAQPSTSDNTFKREGDNWVIGYAGQVVRLRHAKGLADIAALLAVPGREIPALDLAAAAGADTRGQGDLGELIDAQARAAYKRRLEELAEADDERSRAEREALLDQLTSAYGLGGRPRRTGAPAERARTAVTARIRAALDRIAQAHPELGRHLRRHLHTGTMCAYEPDEPIIWHL